METAATVRDFFIVGIVGFLLAGFSMAVAVYGLMMVRWAKRKHWLLAWLNGMVMGCGLYVVWVYLTAFLDPIPVLADRFVRDRMANALVTGILILPAIAKLFELRFEHKQDARAKKVVQVLTNGHGAESG